MHCSNPSHPILMYAGGVALIFANMADAAFAKKQSWEAIGVKTMNDFDSINQDAILNTVESEVAHTDRTAILFRYTPKTELPHDFTDALDTVGEPHYAQYPYNL